MKSHASLVAQQTRLREWAELVKDCQNRPQGNHLTLEITDQVSASFLHTLLGVMMDAQ